MDLSDDQSTQLAIYAAAQSNADVVLIGDSITLGGDWRALLGPRVENRAIGGATTDLVFTYLPTILHGIHPKIAVVMLGINDITHPGHPTALMDYYFLLESLAASGMKIVVESVLYCSGPCNVNAPAIKKLNENLQDLKPITFLDLNPILAPSGSMAPFYTTDGIHLTPLAYRIWAEQLRDTLRSLR